MDTLYILVAFLRLHQGNAVDVDDMSVQADDIVYVDMYARNFVVFRQ